MTDEALFLNGVYESVLKGIIRAQKKAGPDEVFYGSPVHAGIDRQQGVPFPFCPFAITWISLSSKELAH